jgi:hypothetical protein
LGHEELKEELVINKLRDRIADKSLEAPAAGPEFEERLSEKRAQAAQVRLEARRARVGKLLLERARRLHLSADRKRELQLQQIYYERSAAAISADQEALSEAITTLQTAILPLQEEARKISEQILRLRAREQEIDRLFRPSSELKQSLEGQLEALARELADLQSRSDIDGEALASDWWMEPRAPYIEHPREPSFAYELANPRAVASPARRAEELKIQAQERNAIEQEARVERLAHMLGVSLEDAKLVDEKIITS